MKTIFTYLNALRNIYNPVFSKKGRPVSVLLFVLCCLSGHPGFAQAPFNVWMDRFPNTVNTMGPSTVEIALDGGYIVAGNATGQTLNITKFKPNGILQWSKDFGHNIGNAAYATAVLSDSGYAVTGKDNNSRMCVLRTDKNGTLLWSKIFTPNSGSWIQQTLDGGIIVGGMTNSSLALIKMDLNGTVQWSGQYYNNSGGIALNKGIQLSDSSYVLSCSGNGMILFGVSKTGVLQWQKEYDLVSGSAGSASMRRTRDNGFILAGNGGGSFWCAMKINAAGAVQWCKSYKPASLSSQGHCYDVEELDYGYAFVGGFYDYPPAYSTSFIMKTDPNGNVLWNRTFNEKYWDWLLSVKQTADKGLIAWGHTQIDCGGQIGNLIKTDSTGQGTCKFSNLGIIETTYSVNIVTPSMSGGNSVFIGTNTSDVYSGPAAKQFYPCTIATGVDFKVTNTVICAGSSVTFSTTSSNALSCLSWTFPGGSPATSAATGPTVRYDSTGVYSVILIVTDVNGLAILNKTAYITVLGSHVPGIITAHPDTICAGDSAQLTVSGVTGNIHWQSSVNANTFTDIPGANLATYTAPPLSQTTYYRVTAGAGNCSDTSLVHTITVNALPPPPQLTISDSAFCSGDSAQLCASSGYSSYIWNTSATAICTEVKSAGGYWVTGTDVNGCKAVSEHQQVSVYPVPSVSIVVQGDTFLSFNALAYQWYEDGFPISNATSSFYIAQQPGAYAVAITDSNGCEAVSNPITFTGINDIEEESLQLYPNPSSIGLWQLTVGKELFGRKLEVYDNSGRLVFQSSLFNHQSSIALDISRGVYLLRISSPEANIIRKLIRL